MILPNVTRSHDLKQLVELSMQNAKGIGNEICDDADEESGVSGTSKLLSAPPDSELKGESWSVIDCVSYVASSEAKQVFFVNCLLKHEKPIL